MLKLLCLLTLISFSTASSSTTNTFYSNTDVWIRGWDKNNNPTSQKSYATRASEPVSGWSQSISGAVPIWDSKGSYAVLTEYMFSISGTPTDVTLEVKADDEFDAYLNGKLVCAGRLWNVLTTCSFEGHVNTGYNFLQVIAVNSNGPSYGLIYKLSITSSV